MIEDREKYMKPFGKYEADAFKNTMSCLFGLQSTPTDQEVLEQLQGWRVYYPGSVERLVEAMREFLRDPYLTFAQKTDVYLDEHDISEEDAIKYWKRCWSLVAPDEPWPLDEKPEQS